MTRGEPHATSLVPDLHRCRTLRLVCPNRSSILGKFERALHAGQKIQVVEMNSKKHSGTFVNVSDTAISYQKTASAQTIQKQDVRSVKLMENKFRLRTRSSGVEWALVREL